MSIQNSTYSLNSVSTDDSIAMLLECDETLEDKPSSTNIFRIPSQVLHPPSDYLSLLKDKESEYSVNPKQWLSMQTQLNSEMRGILLDWLMEVSGEYRFKRETYYLAMSYVDRYLLQKQVEKDVFQLIGLAALAIAVKAEEIKTLKLEDLAKAADYAFDENEIRKMEIQLLAQLQWKIYPITPFHWLSYLMTQWDIYIMSMFNMFHMEQDQFITYDREIFRDVAEEEIVILFKQPNKSAYKRYREALFLLDMLHMELSSYTFTSRELGIGLLYILIKKYFEQSNFSLFLLHNEFKTHFYNEEASDAERYTQGSLILYEIFSDFAAKTAEIYDLQDMGFLFQLISLFSSCAPNLNFRSFDIRRECVGRERNQLSYEEFLGIQTYNAEVWKTVSEIIKSSV
ncbi:unnamed protein product [Blepharisma stoltei]|uniref:Cyclin-like domain-containing protein n=1 Tax=Blepharisma stoltei TaxID=1481888 RepID=A0AAU9J0K8_9CILI|nr:unnamed protein product [Blepharisma stoltei]